MNLSSALPFRLRIPASLCLLFLLPKASGAVLATYDIIDQQFNSTNAGYTGPGRYDLFHGVDGTASPDGYDDIEVRVSASGFGAFAGVNYTGSVDDATTTGLVSSISSTGASASNNNGHVSSNVIEIRFLSTMTVTVDNIFDFSFSSGNTAGISWETTYIQYLDLDYGLIGLTPSIGNYAAHTPLNGLVGNAFIADSKGTVLNVGTNLTTSGTGGSNDASPTAFDTPLEMGIPAGTPIGGVRFVHQVEDVRGTSNGNNSFTSTINDLELRNFSVIPEPQQLLLVLLFSCLKLRSRRRPGNLVSL